MTSETGVLVVKVTSWSECEVIILDMQALYKYEDCLYTALTFEIFGHRARVRTRRQTRDR
jgi:hypothetical protein